MNLLQTATAALWLATAACTASAANYALSTDGSAVVRLVDQGTVTAASLNGGLLPSGWTQSTATGGSMGITSYKAGFSGTTGGAEIKALFDLGATPASGSYVEWAQVINTNLPLGGNTSPYLDNAADTSKPFYSFTAANTTPGLAAGKLNFYDFSRRDPASLSSTNPITWNAKLYPVVADASNALSVHDGVSWGWTMKKAMVGSVSGTFTQPSPLTAIVSGVGTSAFTWGTGPSSLSFSGATFDAMPDTIFKLGTLTFHNGTNANGSSADQVSFNANLHFDNVPEKDFTLSTNFGLINTPNTNDPIASADQVSIGSWGYQFNVLEGGTATVDLMAKLSTGLIATVAGTESGASTDQGPFEPSPSYSLTVVGLTNVSGGGFVTAVPEPATYALFLVGGLLITWRARHQRLRPEAAKRWRGR